EKNLPNGNVRMQIRDNKARYKIRYAKQIKKDTQFMKVVKGKILNSSTLNVLYEVDGHWDRTIKVKDTNNRKARVIYDAKEVINGLQAPIVKDAEDSTFGIQEAENL
ncbi:hypothetical protein HN873_038967, partial [Arachis hypogaea]